MNESFSNKWYFDISQKDDIAMKKIEYKIKAKILQYERSLKSASKYFKKSIS